MNNYKPLVKGVLVTVVLVVIGVPNMSWQFIFGIASINALIWVWR